MKARRESERARGACRGSADASFVHDGFNFPIEGSTPILLVATKTNSFHDVTKPPDLLFLPARFPSFAIQLASPPDQDLLHMHDTIPPATQLAASK